jgi:hypothetical protein
MAAGGSGMVLAVIGREEEYWYKTYPFLMSTFRPVSTYGHSFLHRMLCAVASEIA